MSDLAVTGTVTYQGDSTAVVGRGHPVLITVTDAITITRVWIDGVTHRVRHVVTIPPGLWKVTADLHDDGTADLELEMVSMKGVRPMTDELTAYTLANITAGVLESRDDIASAIVNPSEDIDQATIEVTGQGGRRFLMPVVALRERT